ncbi:unnamed protein product [Acanthoscelides obtectus]|uniref:Integrase p58-like C-terminal domain-containing protein n=1 Tax=Acanthoscelides obtectus TaxID=200917 RepID=A0A9P0QJ82_ACAOB|nr:unnamed protein product [Acanthoscelides obtectus]CAK1686479.1 hypothetical protein AOBTE_LOCUS35978 [Acanthoscelides obtectus]
MMRERRNEPFAKKWVGPYQVVKQLDDVTYEVLHDNGVAQLHVDDLRPSRTRYRVINSRARDILIPRPDEDESQDILPEDLPFSP